MHVDVITFLGNLTRKAVRRQYVARKAVRRQYVARKAVSRQYVGRGVVGYSVEWHSVLRGGELL